MASYKTFTDALSATPAAANATPKAANDNRRTIAPPVYRMNEDGEFDYDYYDDGKLDQCEAIDGLRWPEIDEDAA